MTSFQDLGGSQWTLGVNYNGDKVFAKVRKDFLDTERAFERLRRSTSRAAQQGADTTTQSRANVRGRQSEAAAERALNVEQARRARDNRARIASQARDIRAARALLSQNERDERSADRDRVRRDNDRASEQRAAEASEIASARRIDAVNKQRLKNEKSNAGVLKAMRKDEAAAIAAGTPVGNRGLVRDFLTRLDMIRRSVVAEKTFGQQLKESVSAGNQLGFTFRRLFGVLAIFTLARESLNGLAAAIKSFFSFNQETEDARRGIAALLTTLTDISVAGEKIPTGPQAFAVASKIAQQQVALLRGELGRTTASFNELQEAFQIALPAAVNAGFNLDQVREFTVLVSQAAQAISLPQAALNEEIRAILGGNVQGRTTQLARVFGGASVAELNEQINKMKALGPEAFFNFLTARLGAFNLAANDTAKSFTGIQQSMRNAVQATGGAAIAPLFERIKVAMSDIRALFANRVGDNFLPRPEAMAVLAVLFDGIKRTIDVLAGSVKSLTFQEVLTGAQRVADTFVFIAEVGKGAFVGITAGVKFVTNVLAGLLNGLNLTGGGVGATTERLTRFFTILSLTKLGISSVVGTLSTVLGPLAAMTSGVVRLSSALLHMGATGKKAFAFTLGVAGLAASLAIAKEIADTAFGFQLSLVGFVEAVFISIKTGLNLVLTAFQGLGTVIIHGLGFLITSLFAGLSRRLSNLLAEMADGVRELLPATAASLDAAAAGLGFAASQFTKNAKAASDELKGAFDFQSVILEGSDQLNALREHERAEKTRRAREDREAQNKAQSQQAQRGAGLAGPRLDFDTFPTSNPANEQRARLDAIVGRAEDARKRGEEIGAAIREGVAAKIDTSSLEKEFISNQAEQKRIHIEALRATADTLREQGQSGAAQVLIDQAQELEGALNNVGQAAGKIQLTEFQKQLAEGLKGFVDGIAIAVNLISGMVTTTGAFIADTLVDAFDPTQDMDIRERFARFLQDIARMVITQLTQLAVAKAILGITGSVAGAAGGGQVTGLHRGGQVGRARGYAGGGEVRGGPAAPQHYGVSAPRPAGLHPTDTQAVWLALKEFVQPAHVVERASGGYGADFMEALRLKRIPVAAARALMGGGAHFTPRAHAAGGGINRVRGMAAGGLTAGSASAIRTAVSSNADGRTTVIREILPVLVAGRQNMDRLMHDGGDEAVNDHNRRNSSLQGAIMSRKAG